MDKIRNLFGYSPSEDEDPTEPESPMLSGDAERAGQRRDPSTPVPGDVPAVKPGGVGTTRRLPPLESALVRTVERLTFGHSRDIGMVRSNNEDSTFTFFSSQCSADDYPDFGIFIVADGAGGHADGERASAVVSRTVADYLSRHIYQPMLTQDLANQGQDRPPITEVLAEAVRIADQAVKEAVPGGGSTLTAAVTIGDLAHFAHVGDSRAYLITTDKEAGKVRMEQLTRDHSVAKRLEEIGQITAQEAINHPEASRLWKIMGLTDNLEPEIFTRRLPPHSHLVICSDGLWNQVPADEIRDAVISAATPQEACNRLVVAANGYGGNDNISVIVLNIPGD